MSQQKIQAQRVDINYDSLLYNGTEFMKSDSANITFTGGVGATSITTAVVFSRTGNVACINFKTPVYNGQQAAGLIQAAAGSVPVGYRPLYDAPLLNGVMIINGSAVGASATQATQLGCMKIATDGSLQLGITVDNAAVLTPFGGSASSGSGNGICSGSYCYPIGIR